MIYLLHGEDVGASRQYLLELKNNYASDSVSVFDAKKFDADEFFRACETPSLLSDRRLIVVEGNPRELLIVNRESLGSGDLAIWIGEELKSSNKLFKQVKELGGQIRHFKPVIPKHVFGFLDALGYKNKKKAFLELHRLLDQGEAPLYLLTMIVWQIRNLLKVQFSANGGPKPKMAPFVLRKAQGQAKNFEEEELIGVFKNLLDVEVKLKTTQIDPVLVLDRVVDGITNPKF